MATTPPRAPLHRISAAVGPDMTLRQLAILEALFVTAPEPMTVRALAARFGFCKPVITRATQSLADMELVTRKPDPADGRSVLIAPTLQGEMMIVALGRIFRGL